MKNLSQNYKNHIAESSTTLALIVKIVRKDNTEYLYTDHDNEIVFGGDTYSPLNAFIPTDFQTSSTLSVDNLDITGIINEAEGINESDIHKQYFYDAKIYLSQVNYNNPDGTGQNKILFGSLGELTLQEDKYIVEFRSLTYPLTRKIADVFSKTCRVEFGSTECGVSLDPSTWLADTDYCVGDVVEPTTPDGRRYVTYSNGTSGSSEPTWNTTVGGTTTDGTLTWSTEDAYQKSANILCPTKIKVQWFNTVIVTATRFQIEEVRFFDHNNSRVFASAVTGTTYVVGFPPSYTNDDLSTVWPVDEASVIEAVYDFSSPFRLTKFNINITGPGYCSGMQILVSYDGGTTYKTIHSNIAMGQAFWLNNSNFYETTNLVTGLDGAIYVGNTLFDNMDYLIDGRIVFTSGNNNNLGMEITSYDSTTGILYLFNPMPERISFNDSLDLIVGCNHLYIGPDGTTATGHCDSRFNNGKNFRGEPFVPTEDVLVGGIGETNKENYQT